MNVKDEAVKIVADSIIFGYGKASIKFITKLLIFSICKFEDFKEDKSKTLEEDLNWFIEEKIKELRKEEL